MSEQPIFEVSDLSYGYGGAPILTISSLAFAPRRIYCLYGPNGSGKTTLFELLTLMRTPQRGRIRFQGREIFPQGDGVARLREQAALVYQDPLLFDTTVERNVDYGLRVRRIDRNTRRQRVRECLRLVGLDGFEKRAARKLSGGETQRVAIARAFALHPSALFLDEFSANVDEQHRLRLEQIIRHIRDEFGATVIFTTHYLDQAHRVADEVLHLVNGRLAASPPTNLLRGVISREGEHVRFSTGRMTFELVAAREGAATVALPANSIVVSAQPLESSMRNALRGQITHIIDAGDAVRLKVMAGESLDVTLTKESYHRMGLHPGMPVYLNFKATAVEVF